MSDTNLDMNPDILSGRLSRQKVLTELAPTSALSIHFSYGFRRTACAGPQPGLIGKHYPQPVCVASTLWCLRLSSPSGCFDGRTFLYSLFANSVWFSGQNFCSVRPLTLTLCPVLGAGDLEPPPLQIEASILFRSLEARG
jgi:hypothetical protein